MLTVFFASPKGYNNMLCYAVFNIIQISFFIAEIDSRRNVHLAEPESLTLGESERTSLVRGIH